MTNPLKLKQVLPVVQVTGSFPDRMAFPHGPWPSDEGVPGGGVSFPIDCEMADSRIPTKLSADERAAGTEARARKEAKQRTFRLTEAQVLAGQGTNDGEEHGEK
jgi:hypothetical protein